jgi:PucR C-terminal helix-turn-helix domain
MPTVTSWQRALLAAGTELGPERLGAMASAALERALPVLRSDSDLLAAARASSVANLLLVFAVVRGDIELDQIEPPPQAVAFTRELARRGVPVSELARGYRIAQHTLWRWAVGEVRRRLADPVAVSTALEELSEATFATGDLLSTLIMERYAQERERWVRSADAVRIATVEELLAGSPVDVAAASVRLRYELTHTHEAFIVWADRDDAVPEGAAAAVGGPRALLVTRGIGVIAGWAPAGTVRAGAASGSGAVVALGLPAPGADGFRLSHAQALEAQRVARTFGAGLGFVRYDQVARLALLTQDPEQARDFASRVLGPLAAQDKHMRRLAETLFVVLEEQGSPRRAGRRLGVHENTVAKRMRAIEALLAPEERAGPSDLLAALTIALAPRYATAATAGSSL